MPKVDVARAPALRVVVAGLPYSGNRLVKGLVEKAGLRARIFHGGGIANLRGPRVMGYSGPQYRAIIPVRERSAWLASCRAHDRAGPVVRIDEDRCRQDVFEEVTQAQIPIRLVSYESIVADPIATGTDLWRFIGAEPPVDACAEDLWGVGVFDGNAKYRPPVPS